MKMFETGMSALVLKICSEYAKSLGLNFPPCTQQEINAICEWVDKHTIKDMTISQDGYNVTFTFITENDTTKEFTFTIPKKVDIDELEKVLVGSETVVVERTEDNSKLKVRLAQSVTTQINSKLDKPATPTADSAVTMLADGTVGTKPLSEIGGDGGKIYRHDITIYYNNQLGVISNSIYNTSDILIENIGALENYRSPWSYNSYQASGSVFVEFNISNATFDVKGVVCKRSDQTVYVVLEEGMTVNRFSDIVTEV